MTLDQKVVALSMYISTLTTDVSLVDNVLKIPNEISAENGKQNTSRITIHNQTMGPHQYIQYC